MTNDSRKTSPLRGRCIAKTDPRLIIQNQSGRFTSEVLNADAIRVGDIVEVTGRTARVLTATSSADPALKWTGQVLDPRRLRGVRRRTEVEALIREFFATAGFLETRTPLLVPCPGMEPHIRPFEVRTLGAPGAEYYLPTSPEFAMKRLLVGGLERIFQLSPAFRSEPISRTHHPEFTMLEWYRAYAGYEDIMRDVEELLAFVAVKLNGKPELRFQGRTLRVAPPWPRLRVRDLFREHVGVDLVKSATREALAADCARLGLAHGPHENWDDLYFKIWLNLIEPRLPEDQAVFVVDYPASQAALAVLKTEADGSRWAKRFEVYAAGLELGNAFEELTDPAEQRRRFVEDMELRTEVYGPGFPKTPLDEEFLAALEEGLPPAGGIAMGVDRLVMLFADEPELQFTLWLP